MIFGKIKRQGEAAHEPVAKVEHSGKIGLHGGPERGHILWPKIWTTLELPCNDTRIVERKVRTDVKTLLQVRRGAGFERLRTQTFIAAMANRMRHIDDRLRPIRQVKKAL